MEICITLLRDVEKTVNVCPFPPSRETVKSFSPRPSVPWGVEETHVIVIYIIIKWMRALRFINQLWFTVPVNSWKFRVSSELLYKSNRPQIFMVYGLINHLGCWENTRRIRKWLAFGLWFTNSSRVLSTSRVVYQPINHKNLWSIA